LGKNILNINGQEKPVDRQIKFGAEEANYKVPGLKCVPWVIVMA